MTYHKRPLQVRKCAHCRAKFETNHKSRLYCSNSCNTLAWRARQPAAEPAALAGAGEGRGALALSAQNVGVLALGSAIGTAAVQGSTALWQHATQGGTPQDLLLAEVRALRHDVARLGVPSAAGFLPDAVGALFGPMVPLRFGQRVLACVRVEYEGHVLYHHAERRLLLCETAGGGYRQVASAPELAQLLAGRPHERPAVSALAASPAANAGNEAAQAAAFERLLLADLPSAKDVAVQAAEDAAFQAALAREWFGEGPAPDPA